MIRKNPSRRRSLLLTAVLALPLVGSTLLGCRADAHGRLVQLGVTWTEATGAPPRPASRPNLDPDGPPRWAASSVG